MPDTFPLLQKEGKLFYVFSHSSLKLRLTTMPRGVKESSLKGIKISSA